MPKIYDNRDIYDEFLEGNLKKLDDGFKLEVETKPNGSNSVWVSVGKFIESIDDFGERCTAWEHHDYPNQFKFEGFKVKRNYEGNGAGSRINWTMLIPQSFIDAGYSIALMGSGIGGRGYKKTDINIIFSRDRVKEGAFTEQ